MESGAISQTVNPRSRQLFGTDGVRGRAGEFLTIVGPSGAGKSTLLNMIAQIDTVSEGEIVFDGESMATHDARALRPGCGRRIGYVTQDDNLLPWRTTFDNVLFPIEVQGRLDDKMRSHAEMLELGAVCIRRSKKYKFRFLR